MIRLLLIVGLIVGGLQASQIEKKIQKSKKTLQSTEAKKKQMNRQLSKIAASIAKTRKELAKLEKILDRLEKEQKKGESDYKEAMKKIAEVENEIGTLDKSIKAKHDRFVQLLSDQFAMIVATEQMNRKSEKSILLKEFYEAYKQSNDKELQRLKSTIDENRKKKVALMLKRTRLKRSIASIVRKRKEYQQKREESKRLLQKLAKEEALYRQKLKNIITRQNLLRLTLAKLNILKKEEIEAAKRREAERKAQLERRAKRLAEMRRQKAAERAQAKAEGREVDYTEVTLPPEEETAEAGGKVKQYGSSYQKERVAAYRGRKTIPPFRGARVVKKFGTYVDPIYKIKIFNDSVTLKAPALDTKVRNVLNGKVVYIGENSMLGKVVIVQHGNGLHTVYAGLSKISPLIRTGSRIRKGTVIGKVRKKLIFQATQNSKLINPLRLIQI
ncbi:peptidoglycan DD-metalloendopeptidase family protein [Nitratifractor sp.]